MNKNQSLLLEDYLRDQTETRLSILVSSINPGFKLNKANKEHVKLLISDYAGDKTKTRLRNISLFLSGDINPQLASKKPVKLNKVFDGIPEVALTDEEIEFNSLNKQYKELVAGVLSAKGDKQIIAALKPEMQILEQRIDAMVRRRENQPLNLDPIAEETKILEKLFGKFDNEESIAYRVLNDKIFNFRIKTYYNPEIMIEKLFIINRKQPVKYSARIVSGQQNQFDQDTWQVSKGDMDSFNQGQTKIGG